MNLSLSRNVPRIDHREVQARQRTAWASGDYAVAGNALQIVSEELCETVNLCQDERVLDVAAGSFHGSLAAAPPLVRRHRDGPCLRPHQPQPPARRSRRRRRAVRRCGRGRLAIRRPELQRGDLGLRGHVRGRPGTGRLGDDPRVPPRRPGRARQLDPRRLHRPVVCHGGEACPAGDLRAGAVPAGAPRAGSKSCLAPTGWSSPHSSAWRCAPARRWTGWTSCAPVMRRC